MKFLIINNLTQDLHGSCFFFKQTNAEIIYPIMKTNIIIGGHYYVKIC
nr:MAG TPA: hypothetical protein [Caudoviricetes sp.]